MVTQSIKILVYISINQYEIIYIGDVMTQSLRFSCVSIAMEPQEKRSNALVRIGRITSIPIEKYLQVVILIENWLELCEQHLFQLKKKNIYK